MNCFIKIVSLIGILAMSQIAYSAPGGGGGIGGGIGVGGGGGKPTENTLDFSGYSSGFSSEGAVKNVVVQSQFLESGIRYHVRSFYASSIDTVSIDGDDIHRPFFGVYASADTDFSGNVVGIYSYIETPDTEDYINYNIEASHYDPVSLVKFVDADNQRESWVCNGGGITVCLYTDTLTDGTFQYNGIRTQVRALSGPFVLNGMTFNEVRIEHDQGQSNNRTRLRAKGIGEILRRDAGQNDRELIYFQANGTTGGSLMGTPFAPGGLLDGLLF